MNNKEIKNKQNK